MKALVLTTATREVHVRERPIPSPGVGEVLVRVHAIALNPVDSLYVAHPIAAQEERVIGTDFAGVIVGASPDITDVNDLRTKRGTRVAGFLQGACSANDRPGAFAEYVTAPYDLLWEVPTGMSLQQAATVSMCGLTAAQGVFYRLGLPSPFSATTGFLPSLDSAEVINVLIYGASTSLGMYAAQLVRLAEQTSGRQIRLIGTAGKTKHDMLRAPPYGYDVLIDYRDKDWPEQVRAATGGTGVQYAIDTISEGETVAKVESSFGPTGALAVFRGPAGGGYDPDTLRIKPMYGAAWEGLGVEIGYNNAKLPASPSARDFAARFFAFLSSEAARGGVKLEPNPTRLMPGGLDRVVPDGFVLLGDNLVSSRGSGTRNEEYMRPISGEKLVYTIASEDST